MPNGVTVTAPDARCPKCGQQLAFVGSSPTYRERSWTVERPMKNYNDHHYEEFLAWPCKRCGYEWETPTVDAP